MMFRGFPSRPRLKTATDRALRVKTPKIWDLIRRQREQMGMKMFKHVGCFYPKRRFGTRAGRINDGHASVDEYKKIEMFIYEDR